jgi:hypothetical protein
VATRVRARAACRVCGEQSGTEAGFAPSTSVSPANYSTNFSIIIITQGWHNRPISGRSAEWTQLDSTPTVPIKKISRQLLTAANRVRAHVKSCGICGGRIGIGTVFSPSNSASPSNFYFTDCSTLILNYYPGLVQ